MRFIFDDDETCSFETLRTVGYAAYGGADIGEVITTQRITPGDWESWYREWRSFEHRIGACIAHDGVFSMAAAMPKLSDAVGNSIRQGVEMQSMITNRAMAPTSQRWVLSNALWVFDVATGRELLDEVDKYDLADVAGQIRCPTLVCESRERPIFDGQPAMLFDALRWQKTFQRFTAAEGAGEHCHEGALTLFHRRMFDWLDDTLKS